MGDHVDSWLDVLRALRDDAIDVDAASGLAKLKDGLPQVIGGAS